MNGLQHYDRQGKPISFEEYARRTEDQAYRLVRQEVTPLGYFVSTVWLGLDHSFGRGGPPTIFETMVQRQDDGEWVMQRRYETEKQALVGHLKEFIYWSDPEHDSKCRLTGRGGY